MYVHAPSACTTSLPLAPVNVSAVNAFAVPSTSVDVSLPLVLNTESVSVKFTLLLPLITAASFVPVMLTITVLSLLVLNVS